MADTTVYSIFAGYIPQLGVGKTEFTSNKVMGTKRTYSHGTRYDGKKRTLGRIDTGIHTDGKLGAARVRGSVAWYEHTTSVRPVDITNALASPYGGQDLSQEIMDLSNQWYGGGSLPGWRQRQETRDTALLEEFERLMGIGDIQPVGQPITGGEKAEPEEQALQSTGKRASWKPDDAELRKAGRVIGANAIDVYFRDEKGDIHRLDVTAQSLDDKTAHHGLTSFEDRKEAGVTGQQLLATIEGEGGIPKATEDLENYFNKVQEKNWNPPIRAMKEIIKSQSLPAAELLKDLEAGTQSLADLRIETDKKLQELVRSMRGKDTTGLGTTETGRKGAKVVRGTGKHKKSTRGGWQASANAIRKWYLSQAGQIVGKSPAGLGPAAKDLGLGKKGISHPTKHGGKRDPMNQDTEAMNAGLEFALHMLGNVMELFRSDSARQGGYSTAYTMGSGGSEASGKQARAANFVVEVKHTISPSGADVFEFIKMKVGDVIIHNVAALTSAYQMEHWYEGNKDTRALIMANAIRQNQLATLQVMGITETGVRIGDVVALSHEITAKEASAPMPNVLWHDERSRSGVKGRTHAGSAKILPQKVNDSINLWLHGGKDAAGNEVKGVTMRGGDAKIKQLLKKKTREFAQEGSAYGKKQHIAFSPEQVRNNNMKLTGAWAVPRNINQSALSGVGGGGNPGIINGQRTRWSQFPLSVGAEAALGNIHGITTRSTQREQEVADVIGLGINPHQEGGPSDWANMVENPWERAGNVTFWGTPYLSVLYPSTQVRVND